MIDKKVNEIAESIFNEKKKILFIIREEDKWEDYKNNGINL